MHWDWVEVESLLEHTLWEMKKVSPDTPEPFYVPESSDTLTFTFLIVYMKENIPQTIL